MTYKNLIRIDVEPSFPSTMEPSPWRLHVLEIARLIYNHKFDDSCRPELLGLLAFGGGEESHSVGIMIKSLDCVNPNTSMNDILTIYPQWRREDLIHLVIKHANMDENNGKIVPPVDTKATIYKGIISTGYVMWDKIDPDKKWDNFIIKKT